MSRQIPNGFKVVKTRKDHECAQCGKKIPKGEYALYNSERQPVFDAENMDGPQIGIEYLKWYFCYGSGCASEIHLKYRDLDLVGLPYCWPTNPDYSPGQYRLEKVDDPNIVFVGETWEKLWANIENDNHIDIEYEESRYDV